MSDRLRCLKCGNSSGNDWAQCRGLCPMPMSPHYRPDAIRCETCDRVMESGGCEVGLSFYAKGSFGSEWNHRARKECFELKVNWRDRALAAEANVKILTEAMGKLIAQHMRGETADPAPTRADTIDTAPIRRGT